MKEINYSNINYVIGTSAKDNWEIIDNSESDWLWFHLDDLPSPHVIIKSNLKDLKKFNNYIHLLKYAAILCKENSKYKSEKVDIIWTSVNNLTKTKTPGEVIVKGNSKRFKI